MNTTKKLIQNNNKTWTDLIGAFYDEAGLVKLMGSAERVKLWIKSGGLVECITSDGIAVYPAFQFNEYGQPLPHLLNIRRLLGDKIANSNESSRNNDWTFALWLTAVLPDYNKTAAEMLRGSGTEIQAVRNEALAQ